MPEVTPFYGDPTLDICRSLNDRITRQREALYICLEGFPTRITSFEPVSQGLIQISTLEWYAILPVDSNWVVSREEVFYFEEEKELESVFKAS